MLRRTSSTPDELVAECDAAARGRTRRRLADPGNTRKRKDFAKIIELYLEAQAAAPPDRLRRPDPARRRDPARRTTRSTNELRERYPGRPARRVPGHRPRAEGDAAAPVSGRAPPSRPSATRARRSTRGAARRCSTSSTSTASSSDADGSDAHAGDAVGELPLRTSHRRAREPRRSNGARGAPSRRRRSSRSTANGEGWVGAGRVRRPGGRGAYIADGDQPSARRRPRVEGHGDPRPVARYLDAVARSARRARHPRSRCPSSAACSRSRPSPTSSRGCRSSPTRRPSTNRWAARILMGPRFRIHYRDLAPISRWAVDAELRAERRSARAARDRGARPGRGRVLARWMRSRRSPMIRMHRRRDATRRVTRITEFLALYDELRAFVPRGLQQLVQAVADRTGITDSLDASPSRTAPAMRENLNGFIGICSEFSPLEGDANLADLPRLPRRRRGVRGPDPARRDDDDRLGEGAHRPQGEGTRVRRRVRPVHRRVTRGEPLRQGRQDVLGLPRRPDVEPAHVDEAAAAGCPEGRAPTFRSSPARCAQYRDALKQRAEQDERRLFYVAVTRARKRLYCTAAHWYASEDKAKGPSVFLDELHRASTISSTSSSGTSTSRRARPIRSSSRCASRLVWPPVAFDDEAARRGSRSVDAMLRDRLDADTVLSSLKARAHATPSTSSVIEALEAERTLERPPRRRSAARARCDGSRPRRRREGDARPTSCIRSRNVRRKRSGSASRCTRGSRSCTAG